MEDPRVVYATKDQVEAKLAYWFDRNAALRRGFDTASVARSLAWDLASLPSAAAPDDALAGGTPAARERDVHRDLRAENERLRAALADAQDWLDSYNERWQQTAAARDAALAGERAAREALARVEALIDQPAPDGWVRYRVLVSDLRAALSPTPPDTAGDEFHVAGCPLASPGAVRSVAVAMVCRCDEIKAAYAAQPDPYADLRDPSPPDTAEQEPQIPPHEHFYLIGERRCGFTVDAGRCQHTAGHEPAPDSEGEG